MRFKRRLRWANSKPNPSRSYERLTMYLWWRDKGLVAADAWYEVRAIEEMRRGEA